MSPSAAKSVGVIERLSETPYYQQLAIVLEGRLQSGDIPPASRLPSESKLRREFGLSRATVRQALLHLETQGLVQRVPNRGVFARERGAHHGWVIQGSEGFLKNAILHQGRSVTTRVIRAGYMRLPVLACRELGLAEDAQGYELVRMRYLDGAPALFSTNYLPPLVADIVAGTSEALDGTDSLTDLLTRSGYPPTQANRSVRSVLPPAEVAAAMEITERVPLLQISSTSWTRGDQPVDVYETYVNTAIVLEINVRAMPPLSGGPVVGHRLVAH